MKPLFPFTYAKLKAQYREALNQEYAVIRCCDYVNLKRNGLPPKTLVNRVDIDFSVKKAGQLGQLFNDLGIKATFFVRLHAPEYNPFSFENYRIIKALIQSGHEIGYHSEILDQAAIWAEDAAACLQRDIDVINKMFGIRIRGVASHRGMTGLNNLDFWKDKTPADFDLLYEGYDKQPAFNLFQEAFYVSDSEWTQWKCYNKGTLVAGNTQRLGDHVKDGHALLYLLIHPDTYFERHFYEDEGG